MPIEAFSAALALFSTALPGGANTCVLGVLGVVRRGDHCVGRAVEPVLQPPQRPEQGRALADEAVVEHLGCHTALVVEHQRHAPSLPHRPAEQRAFVNVSVYEVGLELDGGALHSGGKGHVEVEFVPRRSDHDAALPRHVDGAPYVHPRHVRADVVGAQNYFMAPALEMDNLLQYTDVRAVV
jgi:hypothetical protein